MAGEKRSQDQEETLLTGTVILLDIEGTTTSISFVKDTLFTYVRENVSKYVEAKWGDEEFKKDLEKLKEQAKKDEEDKVDGFVPISGANAEEERESLVKNILWQMDCDRKTGALKQLQGRMWREAYNSGKVKAHVYDDVPKALESWTKDGKKVYVYSSGSVEAQKLLFGHTEHGDLLKYFNDYFDTEVGAKQETNSYKNILSKIGAEPSNVIFLTDVVKEATAAKEAGLSAIIVLREGNAALTDEEKVAFTTVKSFLDLTFQTSPKRQKLETAESAQESASTKDKPDATSTSKDEPMDTSEDVEMSDASSDKKKVDNAQAKEVAQDGDKVCGKDQLAKEPQGEKTGEPMVVDDKDPPSTENAPEKSDAQPSSEVSTKVNSAEKAQAAPVEATDAEKSTVSEKVEKPVETKKEEAKEPKSEPIPTATPATPATPATAATASEPKAKSEDVSNTENKTEQPTNVVKETKSEDATVTDEKVENSVNEKSEECAEKVETETKEEPSERVVSKTETQKTESEAPSAKSAQEATKAEDKPAENGDVPLTNVEKISAPTIKEAEAVDSKADGNTEAKSATESMIKETEETAATPKAKDPEETTVDKQKGSAEPAAKQESADKSTSKEEAVDEAKETNADSEKKKLNGTTQNGDTTDDKLQRNGLNEGPSNENVSSSTSESTSAQNGEPESSSEGSGAESIKVKKVVDSAVADGAGEPDVVPPVVVAATS